MGDTKTALEALNRIREMALSWDRNPGDEFYTVRQALEQQRGAPDKTPPESDYESMNHAWFSKDRTEIDDRYIVGFAEGISIGRQQRVPDVFRRLVALVSEMCDRIDSNAEDIGTDARSVGELLKLIGPTVDEAKEVLAAAPEANDG